LGPGQAIRAGLVGFGWRAKPIRTLINKTCPTQSKQTPWSSCHTRRLALGATTAN
jgi:hypothetical protein